MDCTLLQAVHCIQSNNSRAAIVINNIDNKNKVVGVISEGDIMRALLHGSDIHSMLTQFIKHDFKYLNQKNYKDALELFKTYGISLIPIIDDDLFLSDVITLSDLFENTILKDNK